MNTLLFRVDKEIRDTLYVPAAYAHPAKANIYMMQTITEMYSQEGDTLLDCMGGVGSTMIAALMGRNVVLTELEQHFIEPMKASWEKMRQHPMLFHPLGHVTIIRGDARCLPLNSADGVVFSPPYANRLADTYIDDDPQRMSYDMGKAKIDAVVSSPAYENSAHKPGNLDAMRAKLEELYPGHVGANTIRNGTEYSDSHLNIGNLKGAAYWQAQGRVYAECYRVLRDGGNLVLIVKGFTRAGQYVDLPQQTIDLVESLGFSLFDHWRRELWNLSFWRILESTDKVEETLGQQEDMVDTEVKEIKRMKRVNNGKLDDRLRFEEVIAFKKIGGAEHGGISAVITSPPYEGSLQGEPGIDWTKMQGGTRDMSVEPANETRKASMSGYTKRPSKLFTEERGVWRGQRRKSKRKPLGYGYTKEAPHG